MNPYSHDITFAAVFLTSSLLPALILQCALRHNAQVHTSEAVDAGRTSNLFDCLNYSTFLFSLGLSFWQNLLDIGLDKT